MTTDEKPGPIAAIEHVPPPDSPRAKTVRLMTLDHIDGRTLAARRVRDLEQAIVADLGGADVASTAQQALARRAAVLAAVLEDCEARWAADEQPLELSSYHAGVNALRRVLATLGLERHARPVRTLREHLRGAAP